MRKYAILYQDRNFRKMARKRGNIRKSEVMRVYGKKGKSTIRVPRQVVVQ